MNQINPMGYAGALSVDPEVAASKQARWFARGRASITDLVFYRLYQGDQPVGLILKCHPMEASAWNANARAYFAHQCTLGRDLLPILEYRRVEDRSDSMIYEVSWRENKQNHRMFICAMSKAEAKREFAKIASPTAAAITVEVATDIEAETIRATEACATDPDVE